MGLFQIVMPAAGIVFAICSSGIQTAISKFCCDKKNDFLWLISGLLLSIPTSLILTFIVYTNADFIATRFILNEACSSLLKILSLSFPFAAFHNCINGFYFAKKKTAIPAFSQFFEQIIRFCAVYIYVTIYASDGNASVLCAIYSNLFGEIASFLYCTCAIFYTFIKSKYNNTHKKAFLMSKIREMFKFSFPLTANRLLMHIFQSAEAVLVPAQLIVYGLSKSDSVSIYGILTGMAMPLILFPTALTNSLAVMLLPAVSELNLENNNKSIKSTINKCITFCISTGVLSTAIFIFYGSYAGAIVFNQPEVRNYVCILAWLCPFIYLTVTMGSILNGLGETTATCIQNIDISRHFGSKIWNNNVYGRTFMFADFCMYLPLYKIKPHASYTYECTRLVSDTGIFFIIINRYFSYFLQIYKQAGFRLNSSLWGSRNCLHYIHFFICYFLSLSE